jgi:hypothetical protein
MYALDNAVLEDSGPKPKKLCCPFGSTNTVEFENELVSKPNNTNDSNSLLPVPTIEESKFDLSAAEPLTELEQCKNIMYAPEVDTQEIPLEQNFNIAVQQIQDRPALVESEKRMNDTRNILKQLSSKIITEEEKAQTREIMRDLDGHVFDHCDDSANQNVQTTIRVLEKWCQQNRVDFSISDDDQGSTLETLNLLGNTDAKEYGAVSLKFDTFRGWTYEDIKYDIAK